MTHPRVAPDALEDTRGAEDQQDRGDAKKLKPTTSSSPSPRPPPGRAAAFALSASASPSAPAPALAPPPPLLPRSPKTQPAPPPPPDRPLLERLAAAVALASFVGALNVAASLLGLSLYLLAASALTSSLGWALLALLLLLCIAPLGRGAAGAWRWGADESHAALTAPAPEFARSFVRYVTGAAAWYFPVRVVVEGEDEEEEERDERAPTPTPTTTPTTATAAAPPRPGRHATTLQADGAYFIALEPHSVLPLAIPAVFSTDSALLPRALRGQRVHGLASSVCFGAPLIRHLWWWLGIRPVTRRSIGRLITGREDGKSREEEVEDEEEEGEDEARAGDERDGLRRRRPAAASADAANAAPPLPSSPSRAPRDRRSVVIVPGGVQECLYMRPPRTGVEVAYLTRRRGFVRLALRSGADAIVPAFAFGQSHAFSWLRPGPPLFSRALVARVARSMGAVPLAIWGRGGTPAPRRRPMVVVVGRPLPLPRPAEWAARAARGGDPPTELVQAHLDGYIDALRQLVETHKAAVGFPETTLVVM